MMKQNVATLVQADDIIHTICQQDMMTRPSKWNDDLSSPSAIVIGMKHGRHIADDRMVSMVLDDLLPTTTIRELVIQNTTLRSQSQNSLKRFFIHHNTNLRSVTIRKVFGMIKTPIVIPSTIVSYNSTIQSLHLEHCHLDQVVMNSLAAMLQNDRCSLVSLCMDEVEICEVEMTLLSGALSDCTSSALKSVTFRNLGKKLNEAVINDLIIALALNKSIEMLCLDYMGLDDRHKVARIVDQNQSIQSLSLRHNNLNGISCSFLFGINGLMKNTTLKRLDLSNNPIGNDGIENLIPCLTINHSLESLDLSQCEIWQDGCMALAQSIGSWKTLKNINVDGNEMEFCGNELRNSLYHNTVLLSILSILPYDARLMKQCRIPPVDETLKSEQYDWKLVDFYLRLNNTNRHEVQSFMNVLPPECVAWFLSRPQVRLDPNILFFFLKEIIPTL
jgi:Leucine Rich repeat